MNDRELRAFDFEIRTDVDEENGAIITGTPIVYDAMTDLGYCYEVIDNGALADTDLKDVRFLVNHNTDMIPLARSRNNNASSTMQMSVVDGVGMEIRVNLDVENNTDAKALYSAIERGDISGMSFMFRVDEDRWDDLDTEKPTRHIMAISRVMEVSAVTFPAYAQATISARGLADALDSAKASLESAQAEQRAIERKREQIRILLEV